MNLIGKFMAFIGLKGWDRREMMKEIDSTYEWTWMTFKAQYPGKYLSMTVVGREISIHDSQYLKKGETMQRPKGAFIMFVAEEPGPDEEDGK